MRRAPTTDWRDTTRLYRGLHRTVPAVVHRAGRVGVRGVGAFTDVGDVGAVVAANHLSLADPLFVATACPRPIRWIAKAEVFENPVGRWFFGDVVGCVPVDRERRGNTEAFAQAVRALDARHLVGIFPEGTRALPGERRPPRTGVARLALLTGSPVIPVAVLSDRFWPKGRSLPDPRERVWIRVGEPVRYGVDPAGADDRERARKVAEDVMDRIRALLAECEAARERGEPWPRP